MGPVSNSEFVRILPFPRAILVVYFGDMARVTTVMPAHLQRRMCLSCGFDGRALQGEGQEGIWVCPKCGSDLYARPPKSYAELEALSDSNPGMPLNEMLLRTASPAGVARRTVIGPSRWFLYSNLVIFALAALASVALLAVGAMLGRMM